MKNINNNSINDYNLCAFEYRKAACALEKFEASEAFSYMKGFLISRYERRRSGSSVKYYNNTYLVKVDYIDGKPVKKEKYIRKNEVEIVKQKLKQKKQNRQKYNDLKKDAGKLAAKLQRMMRKTGIEDDIFQNIEEKRSGHAEYRANEVHRKENLKIVTALGENVRSRGECILANLAFAFRIPYVYEPPVELYGFDDRDDIIEEELRPDFMFYVDGEPVLIEFLGMYGQKEYMENWERKQRHYEAGGYTQGRNLVCLACGDSQNIDSQKAAQVLLNITKGVIPAKTVFV